MTLCATSFYLRVFRSQETTLDGFTEPFVLTWKGLLMEIISYIQIFLWSLLLVVPGIICAIKHAQNFNVMIDNPEFTAMECIHRSHEIMDGNKWKYVKLLLSFIGWQILVNFPASAYQAVYGPQFDAYIYFSDSMTVEEFRLMFDRYSSAVEAFNARPVPFLLGLIPVLLTAYICVSKAAFYDLAAGNLVVQDEMQQTDEIYY